MTPQDSKGHGQGFRRETRLQGGHDTRILWLLHGPEGTIQFVVRITRRRDSDSVFADYDFNPWDIGIHYRKEPTDSCAAHFEHCEITDAECWYDGSSLAPSELWERIMRDDLGEDAIWRELEEWYRSRFAEPVPTPSREWGGE